MSRPKFKQPPSLRTLVAAAASSAVLSFAAAPSLAQEQANMGAQWIKYRQAVYTVLGTNFGVIGRMAAGRAPFDAKAAQAAAERVALMGQTTPEVFPAESRSGAPTKAKPEIWTQRAEFDRLMKAMGEKTAALNTAAKSGNLDAVKAAFGEASQSCKACHDKFKME